MRANVLTLFHAIADGVSNIAAELAFHCDLPFRYSLCKIGRIKLYWCFEKQPCVLLEPVPAAARDMIVAALRIATWFEVAPLSLRCSNDSQIVFAALSSNYDKKFVCLCAIWKLKSFPMKN